MEKINEQIMDEVTAEKTMTTFEEQRIEAIAHNLFETYWYIGGSWKGTNFLVKEIFIDRAKYFIEMDPATAELERLRDENESMRNAFKELRTAIGKL